MPCQIMYPSTRNPSEPPNGPSAIASKSTDSSTGNHSDPVHVVVQYQTAPANGIGAADVTRSRYRAPSHRVDAPTQRHALEHPDQRLKNRFQRVLRHDRDLSLHGCPPFFRRSGACALP